jgi:hypothetical protein
MYIYIYLYHVPVKGEPIVNEGTKALTKRERNLDAGFATFQPIFVTKLYQVPRVSTAASTGS